MGNRAVITTSQRDIGLYLHWNGGRDSVNGFLAYCNMKGYRSPESDDYGWISLAMVVGIFNGDGMSAGLGTYLTQDRDNYDNGVYIIENWKVVGRIYYPPKAEEQHEYDLIGFMKYINSKMPDHIKESEDNIDKWVLEHGAEYNFEINMASPDKDMQAEKLKDIILDEDGDWYCWWVGTLNGVNGTMYSQKRNLDEYKYFVYVRAKEGTPDHVMIEEIKKVIPNE